MATSADGFNFENDQSVFNRDDSQPGTIDWECPECAPTGAIVVDGTWYVYTATGESWDLGLFWGPSRDSLPNSKQLLDDVDGEKISAGGKVTDVDGSDFLLMVGHHPSASRIYSLYRMSKDDPTKVPPRESVYFSGAGQPPANPWPNYKHAAIFFDAPTSTWYFFYQPDEPDSRPYGLMTFQAGPPDDTPPATPQNLGGAAASDSVIDLSWSASFDAESGISNYNVYRDGELVAQPADNSFSDSGLSESTTYSYQVSAVNGAGMESEKSEAASATTLASSPPGDPPLAPVGLVVE